MSHKHVLVTGGAGYIGAVLVPELLDAGHTVTVFDAYLYGTSPQRHPSAHERCHRVRGDIRNSDALSDLLATNDFDAVIHLAAISNDPSSELDHAMTESVNLHAVRRLMRAAKEHGVSRFLYASSASVYGVKRERDVTEDLALEPITIYARCKAEGESMLNELTDEAFVGVSIRSATVCGYSPRLRLDLTINLLTDQALSDGRIRVFGGRQVRPNIHVRDLSAFYRSLLDAPASLINSQAFNVSAANRSVGSLAEMIRDRVDPSISIVKTPSNDPRSYHLSAERAAEVLGFSPRRDLAFAVDELRDAYAAGQVPDSDSDIYRNVAWLKARPDVWKILARREETANQ